MEKTIVAILLVMALTACQGKEPQKDTDYYIKHIDEAKAMQLECRNREPSRTNEIPQTCFDAATAIYTVEYKADLKAR
ncbi:MAG: EexN family lipoprotein [Vibrio sp.]